MLWWLREQNVLYIWVWVRSGRNPQLHSGGAEGVGGRFPDSGCHPALLDQWKKNACPIKLLIWRTIKTAYRAQTNMLRANRCVLHSPPIVSKFIINLRLGYDRTTVMVNHFTPFCALLSLLLAISINKWMKIWMLFTTVQ